MPSITVRVSARTGERLREMARRTGEPMQSLLEKAVEDYRRKRFLEEANRAFTALRNNPGAWKEETEERKAWESTLWDGLGSDD